MSILAKHTWRNFFVIFLVLAFTAGIPLLITASGESGVPTTANADPLPWWQQVEAFQALALKWIAALTAIIAAVSGLIAFVLAKLQEVRERINRQDQRLGLMPTIPADVISPTTGQIAPLQKAPSSVLLLLLIPIPFLSGCAAMQEFQSKPGVQLAESLAIQAAQSYFANGGNVDTLWGISQGINAASGIYTLEQQKQAPDVVKTAIKTFANDPTAVNGLSTKVASIIASSGSNSPAETSKVIQAVANGIQYVAATQ